MKRTPSPFSAKTLVLALHAVGFATLATLTWQLYGFYHDDAFITLRYARNWLDGLGPVWNAGEHIQGYTNFLHLLLLTLLGKLGIDLVLASRIVGAAAYGGILLIMAESLNLRRLMRAYDDTQLAAALCFWLTATSVPLVAWMVGGLETTLVAVLLLAGVTLTLRCLEQGPDARTAFKAGIAFALAIMARPDAASVAAVSLAAMLWQALRMRRFQPLLMLGLAIALLQIPYQLWRVQYYGDWVPNTYFAKVYGIPREWLLVGGFFYMLQFALMFPLLPLAALVLFVFMLLRKRLGAGEWYLIALLGAMKCAIIWVGGDHMPYMRFAAPMVPLIALLTYRGLLVLIQTGKGLRLRDLACAMLLFIPAQIGYVGGGELSSGAMSGISVAPYLTTALPKDSVVAVNPAGALPYFTPQLHYIDMLGLNDRQIARRPIHELTAEGQRSAGHFKGDGAYVLSRNPDMIIFGMNWGAPLDAPMFLSDLELAKNPYFLHEYEQVTVWVDVPPAIAAQLHRFAAQPHAAAKYRLQLNEQGQLRFIYFRRKT